MTEFLDNYPNFIFRTEKGVYSKSHVHLLLLPDLFNGVHFRSIWRYVCYYNVSERL